LQWWTGAWGCWICRFRCVWFS